MFISIHHQGKLVHVPLTNNLETFKYIHFISSSLSEIRQRETKKRDLISAPTNISLQIISTLTVLKSQGASLSVERHQKVSEEPQSKVTLT